MMTRFIIIAMFLHMAGIASSQSLYKDGLSRQEVNNLLRSLNEKMEDTTRIDILLDLAQYNLQKVLVEGGEKSDLDSAATFINQAKEINSKQISRRREGLISLYESSLLRKRGNTDAARQLVKMAIGHLQNSNDEFHLTLAYLELSRCYDSNVPGQVAAIKNVFYTLFQRLPKVISHEQLDTCLLALRTFYLLEMRGDSYLIKLDFLEHLVGAHRILNDKVDEFWTRKEIADIHYQQGKLDMAIKELLEIAKEQKAGGYPRICFTYDLLSGLYFGGGNYEKALYYSFETIKNVRTELDSFYLSIFYARIAIIYGATGSTAEAINWNLKILNYLIAVKHSVGIYSVMYNITSDLIKLGRSREALDMILDKSNSIGPSNNGEKAIMLLILAKCYASLNKNAMAEKYCQELIKINELRMKRKEITSDINIDRFLASFYLAVGQYGKADKYFKKVVNEEAKGIKVTQYESNFLFKLDSARGHYLSAIQHLQASQKIYDSIFTADKTKQIEELKVAYKTEQKDQLLNLKEQNIQLLTKQGQLQTRQLQQGVILRNISFAVVALLIVIMALLYSRYRVKQRTNKKLEWQQREIAKQNLSLHQLVNEKDWLVKEIHHRVKNNLQVVMSLLNSQSIYIDNEAALTAIHDSQHRVYSMSLIHQKLYKSENVANIDMSDYIRELVSYLSDSFNTGGHIRFELDVEPLEMDVNQAVPFGLILNEAVTNSIKYAFPDGRNGKISISLSKTALDHCLLSISDDGIGLPVHFDDKKTGSLGMTLMKGLSRNLEGHFSIENENGTVIKIAFVRDPGIKGHGKVAKSFVSDK